MKITNVNIGTLHQVILKILFGLKHEKTEMNILIDFSGNVVCSYVFKNGGCKSVCDGLTYKC